MQPASHIDVGSLSSRMNPPEMNTSQLLLVSTLGLGVNLFGMFAMGGHHHHVSRYLVLQAVSLLIDAREDTRTPTVTLMVILTFPPPSIPPVIATVIMGIRMVVILPQYRPRMGIVMVTALSIRMSIRSCESIPIHIHPSTRRIPTLPVLDHGHDHDEHCSESGDSHEKSQLLPAVRLAENDEIPLSNKCYL